MEMMEWINTHQKVFQLGGAPLAAATEHFTFNAIGVTPPLFFSCVMEA